MTARWRVKLVRAGFVKGKSCLSNLLETMNSVMELIEEAGIPVDILFFILKRLSIECPIINLF